MKNITILIALLTACVFSFAQTFVSTLPSNKNVILEEYTGKNCVYCPHGDSIAQNIVNTNPGRVFSIKVHQGNWASGTPNYTTQWSNALAGQYNINSYPMGTINRHVFGTSAVLPRSEWFDKTYVIMGQASPVNIAAQSTIDWATRVLTVVVEVYYTGNAANTTNKLNVALLQNNVIGPQFGGIKYFSTMLHDTLYRHMNMLRHLLTGQWGVPINSTTASSFFTQTFTYTIPSHINNIDVNLADIEVIAFVSEGQQEILTGCKSSLTPINQLAINPRIFVLSYNPTQTCDNLANTYVTLINNGANTISSCEISFSIAGGMTQAFQWNARTIHPQSIDTINLPIFPVLVLTNQTLSVQITKVNGNQYFGSNSILTINKKVANGGGYMTFKLVTDKWCSETSFKFFRPDGSVILQDGYWSNLADTGTTTRLFAFKPDQIGCYKLEVYDTYGDGINVGFGAGYFQLIKYDNTVILNDNGQFGLCPGFVPSLSRYMIDVDMVSGVEENVAVNNVNLYPNPTDDFTNIAVNLVNDASVNVTVYNVYGQLVQVINDSNLSQGVNDFTFNTSSLSSGIYFVKVTINDEIITKKVTVR